MKYKQYEKVINDLGLVVAFDGDVLSVEDEYFKTFLDLSISKQFVFSNIQVGFWRLPKEKQKVIFNSTVELVSTPPEEREEKEKRYLLKFIGVVDDGREYLNISKKGKKFLGKKEHPGAKTIFTESELESIDETGFAREEVKE